MAMWRGAGRTSITALTQAPYAAPLLRSHPVACLGWCGAASASTTSLFPVVCVYTVYVIYVVIVHRNWSPCARHLPCHILRHPCHDRCHAHDMRTASRLATARHVSEERPRGRRGQCMGWQPRGDPDAANSAAAAHVVVSSHADAHCHLMLTAI